MMLLGTIYTSGSLYDVFRTAGEIVIKQLCHLFLYNDRWRSCSGRLKTYVLHHFLVFDNTSKTSKTR